MKRANDQMASRCGRRDLLAGALAGTSLALLGACAQLPGQQPPPQLYRLSPKSTFRNEIPQVPWQLLVELPTAPSGIDTPRIALQRNPLELEYYARSSWTDRAPRMIQTLIIESFENSNALSGVGREAVGLRSDFVLQTELREFQAEYFNGSKPRAHVRINAKLVETLERRIAASGRFEGFAEASADNLIAIVAAFDEALDQVLKKLVIWTLEAGSSYTPRGRQA